MCLVRRIFAVVVQGAARTVVGRAVNKARSVLFQTLIQAGTIEHEVEHLIIGISSSAK